MLTFEDRLARLEQAILQTQSETPPEGYYMSRYNGEEIDSLLDIVKAGGSGDKFADKQLSNLDTPQEALVNLGAGVRPNLADNWDLRNPINQRGEMTYTVQGVPGPLEIRVIDRFKLSASENASAILTVSDACTLLECTPAPSGVLQSNFSQTSDVSRWDRGVYTLSFLYESDVTVRPFVYTIESSVKPGYKDFPATSGKPNIASIQFDLTQGDKTLSVNLQINSGVETNTKVYAVKLECGNNQTLAYMDSTGMWQLLPQPESKPSQIQVECQRYLYSPYYGAFPTAPIGTVFASNQTTGFVNVNIPVLMRTRPVFSGDPSKLWIVRSNGGGAQRPSALSVMGMSGSGVFLSVAASFEPGGEYIMYSEDVSNPSDFLLSAEM